MTPYLNDGFCKVVALQWDFDNADKKQSFFQRTVVFSTVFQFWIKCKQNNKVVVMNLESDWL